MGAGPVEHFLARHPRQAAFVDGLARKLPFGARVVVAPAEVLDDAAVAERAGREREQVIRPPMRNADQSDHAAEKLRKDDAFLVRTPQVGPDPDRSGVERGADDLIGGRAGHPAEAVCRQMPDRVLIEETEALHLRAERRSAPVEIAAGLGRGWLAVLVDAKDPGRIGVAEAREIRIDVRCEHASVLAVGGRDVLESVEIGLRVEPDAAPGGELVETEHCPRNDAARVMDRLEPVEQSGLGLDPGGDGRRGGAADRRASR